MEAEEIAQQLFHAVENRELIQPGKSEHELNEDIFKLADELYGIKNIGINALFAVASTPSCLMMIIHPIWC